MKQIYPVLFTTLLLAGYGSSGRAQYQQPYAAPPGGELAPQPQMGAPDDRSYAQLRGLDNGVVPNQGYPQPDAQNPNMVAPQPKQHHSKKHSVVGESTRLPGDAVKSSVGITDRAAKTGVGMTDKTAKTGLGLTDRAVKTTVGAPIKGVKEVFKAIF